MEALFQPDGAGEEEKWSPSVHAPRCGHGVGRAVVVVELILLSMLATIGAGLIAGGWGRVAAFVILGGLIGAGVAVSLDVPSVEEPEDQLDIVVLGFFLGTIAGAGFGMVVDWLATRHGRHAVSPGSRTVTKALAIIAVAVVEVFLAEWWDVINLMN